LTKAVIIYSLDPTNRGYMATVQMEGYHDRAAIKAHVYRPFATNHSRHLKQCTVDRID
jgi:hypothetical protein